VSSQTPTNRLILGAVLVIVGLAVGERSLASERVECVRSRQTCVLERGSPLRAEPARAISLADVARVEFRERETRGGPRGGTVLVSTRGAELHLAEATLEPARLHHARLAAFFRGEGEGLEIAGETRPWVASACFALAVFGLYQVVTGLLALRRAGAPAPVAAAPRTASSSPPWLRQAALIAGALALLAIGLLGYASLTQGTLVLTCEQRCELEDGGVCMPGETREFSLDAGPHALKIFDPSAPGGWHTREVTLVAGETTSLRCALP
jgi:hypothetical protein